MGTILYVLGVVVLVSGIACLATLAGLAQPYVAGAAILVLAVAAVSGIINARSQPQEPA